MQDGKDEISWCLLEPEEIEQEQKVVFGQFHDI